MDKYSSSVSIIRLSNSFAMFDILAKLPLNNYSEFMNYLSTFPLLDDIKPLTITLIIFGAIVLLIALALILYFLVFKKKGKKIVNGNIWLLALGNKENIKEVTAIGSRLSLKLENNELINKDKLKELGVSSVLVMSNKVTLVIEGQAEKVAEIIKKEL